MRLTAITRGNCVTDIEEGDIILQVDVDGSELTILWDDAYVMPDVCHEILNHPKKTLLLWTVDNVTRDLVIQTATRSNSKLTADLLVTEVTEHV